MKFLIIFLALITLNACGVKKPPAPAYSMNPLELDSSTPTPAPTATPRKK